ncbi:MAG: hypothetical protein EU541_05200 [Promethearchaeota archaeon]|nr:MAG: hypothetical protein EU541_05200 [Candidatus Lokiarchaeota archaeon]
MSDSLLKEYECEIAIIGGGPAGLNAAIYCGRSNRDTIVLDGESPSALERTKEIDNWLGEHNIEGKELIKKFKDHAKKIRDIRFIQGEAISLMLGMGKNMISTRSANITADAVIIATGRGERKDIIKGESDLVGYGVSYCALCDGPLYRDRKVFLYGNSEEVLEDALVLDQMGCQVNIITEKSINEMPEQIETVKQKEIQVVNNMEIVEVAKNSGNLLDKIICKSTNNGETKEFETDALFIFTHVPSNSIFQKAGIELDEKGNIKVDENQLTNLKGVYAAGDVTGGILQVIFAAAEGARAGINAARYIRHIQK